MSPKEEKKEFEKLFEEWKNQFDLNAFISDGIVDYERYEKPHILFVLREMNCKVENDLCENLREYGSGHKTWCNAGRWVKALLDGDTEHPYDMSSEKRAEQLLRVAVMNLKKEGGGSRVNGAELPHEWWYYYTAINKKQVPVISFCHSQVTNLCNRRGHENLFKPLYQDMLYIRNKFLNKA